MAIALISSIAGICLSGYLMTTDTFWGVEWVEEAHGLLVDFTLLLIALHVAGVIFASIEHGENLVKSMLTGKKRRFD
jgi:cytochrome b